MQPPIVEVLHLDERKVGAQEFDRISTRTGLIAQRTVKREEALENFGKAGRDEESLGHVFRDLITAQGWKPNLQIAQLNSQWDSIVGSVIANNSTVDSLHNGVLTIRSQGPAWTTNLTYMAPEILRKVREKLDGLTIKSVRVVGPQTHGPGMRKRKMVDRNIHWK